jgi:hypothetical protein
MLVHPAPVAILEKRRVLWLIATITRFFKGPLTKVTAPHTAPAGRRSGRGFAGLAGRTSLVSFPRGVALPSLNPQTVADLLVRAVERGVIFTAVLYARVYFSIGGLCKSDYSKYATFLKPLIARQPRLFPTRITPGLVDLNRRERVFRFTRKKLPN